MRGCRDIGSHTDFFNAVGVASELNQGSTFYIDLPCANK
jgi:hypothetical protein